MTKYNLLDKFSKSRSYHRHDLFSTNENREMSKQ